MKFIYLISFLLVYNSLPATEFTICCYNCGGLPLHYDYVRAACMQQVMPERYEAEPEIILLNNTIQKLALKILFSVDLKQKIAAEQEWEENRYDEFAAYLASPPTEDGSPNSIWAQRVNETITPYNVQPIIIYDDGLLQILKEHLNLQAPELESDPEAQLSHVRRMMFKEAFEVHLQHDIICLQEAGYLDASLFPRKYKVLFGKNAHLRNGIAWNTERFELVKNYGIIQGKAYAVKLRDKETSKTVLIASAHLTGCNPYFQLSNPETRKADSLEGDVELSEVVQWLDAGDSDLRIIGMDANVTSLHPRLSILKNAGFYLDYENHLEATCTNPYQVLDTRIDWIALSAESQTVASITNIPVLSIGLNSIQTNSSDHAPIASKIEY